jgi:hypothetical protein
MLLKIEEAIRSTLGYDPYTGEILTPPIDYMAYVILKEVEENGMAPEDNCYSGACSKNGAPCGRSWEDEDEEK